ncbi:MAG: hypothetical protein QF898_16625 [SAR202 cluster bacterium]|jgi:hypothetical protein|nr:hypothetical protein [SAR202 cluster bacterium]MDP6714116.1 hypothetical protein [SAR202 cluster bacterium]
MNSSNQNTKIPYRLRVGVTGHRRLPDDDDLSAQVFRAIDRARELVASSNDLPVRLRVISPIAEGADRLVAHAGLVDDTSELEVPLPMTREQYAEDFETDESKAEFDALLEQADLVTVMSESQTREEAYERAGRHVVDRCDVLIALWDGEPSRGRGGTAEVVAYARDAGVPILRVSTDAPYQIQEELGSGISQDAASQISAFNKARLSDKSLADVIGWQASQANQQAEATGIDSARMTPFIEWILPYQARADVIAGRFQSRYFLFSSVLFMTAALAVAIIAGQFLFFPKHTELIWIEVALMIGLLLILYFGRRWRLQERWLSNRFLAERFRSALFLAVVGQEDSRQVSSESVNVGHSSDEWLRRAFEEVWNQRPQPLDDVELDKLRAFTASAWVQDQADYHQRAAHQNEQKHQRLSYAIMALFGATLLTAVLHALEFGGHDDHSAFSIANILVFLALTLPALAGALSGVRAQREYERNAERFKSMVPYLQAIADRVRSASDLSTLRNAAQDAETVMMEETQDWFTIMKFHDFELHV